MFVLCRDDTTYTCIFPMNPYIIKDSEFASSTVFLILSTTFAFIMYANQQATNIKTITEKRIWLDFHVVALEDMYNVLPCYYCLYLKRNVTLR